MDRDLDRLATAVRSRRTELKLGIEPAAKLAGISKDTWKRVEAGLNVRDTTYAAVDRALRWAPGSSEAVGEGREVILTESPAGEESVKISRIPKRELERLLGDTVQSAAIATRGDLTATEILELNRRVLEGLRERGVI
ncbi:helix-turn-helix domain-containing protein [Streptomyces sp. H27-H5]|uniref:helix-turn-helix domain-containing protein n=1 Tax=Streptomyces sp. H27-H5 TaxID=2996460 RepID=UPI00226F9D29|nr:helix-turn-helix domain-containing protein [Streptomyces sp. H27-H5]MCY0962459.1 helix-turn-helix domain-containing protein [Streptomyces sp. H27-H5]